MDGDIPYVRLQLDILISKVFSYHLLNHWVITTAKLHNLSVRQLSVLLDSFICTFTSVKLFLCFIWLNLSPFGGEISLGRGNFKIGNTYYSPPALWRITHLRGKVPIEVIYSIEHGGFLRLQCAILGNRSGAGHSAILDSIIPWI